jgi:hypothetical protein
MKHINRSTFLTGLLYLGLITLYLIAPRPARAEIYKWVDTKGEIHYSQTPPSPGVESEIIKPPPAPPPQPAAEPDSPEEVEKMLEKRQAEEQEDLKRDAAEAERKKKNEEIRRLNCDAATRNLEILQKPGQRRYMNSEGELIRPTDNERKLMIDEAKKHIDENCGE